MKPRNAWLILIAVSVFIGTAYAFRHYAAVGSGNQAEDLPQILRTLDANYLTEDHFVNSSTANFSIRFYYVQMMVGLIRIFGLDQTFFVTTLLLNIVTIFLTALFTYELFEKNLLAGIVATVLTTQTIFQIGGGYITLTNSTLANFVSMIFIYIAFYLIVIKNRLTTGAIFLGIAGIIQPLSSILAFGICATGTLLVDLFTSDNRWTERLLDFNLWKRYIVPTGVYGAMLSVIIVPYLLSSASALTDHEFAMIYGYFRIPHHALPTVFLDVKDIVQIALLLAMTVGIVSNLRLKNARQIQWFLLGGTITIILLGIGNYVFVEVIPTRIFVVLVPIMKSSPIIAWFSLILVAGFITQKDRNWLVSLLVFLYFWLVVGEILAAFILIINLIVQAKQFPMGMRYGAVLGLLTVYVLLTQVAEIPRTSLSSRINALPEHEQALVDYVKNNTEEDAIFVIPHLMQNFRVTASRAVVAIFKTYPANDQGLAEWYQRLEDTYTCTNGTVHGFDTFVQGFKLASNYNDIGDACLIQLAAEYGADYAVLHAESATAFPILFEDNEYKLVRITNLQ